MPGELTAVGKRVQWGTRRPRGGSAVLREDVLKLLKEGEGPRSGEDMTPPPGVSRAAVWKAIGALRDEG